MRIWQRNTLIVIVVVGFISAVFWLMRTGQYKDVSFPDILGEADPKSSSWPAYPSPTPIPTLTLARVFAPDHSWVMSLPQEQLVTMIATGDVLPARTVNSQMVKRNNFLWPFEKTHDVLSAADLTVINLETPLLTDCTSTNQGMIFCGVVRATEGLVFAGVDVATLGNNHVGNYFQEGVEETKTTLTNAGILPVAEGIAYKEVKGTRFAFLSYNDIGAPEAGVPWAEEEIISREVAKARESADVVIVSYHWGEEYVTEPVSRQRELAYLSIDAGADVVLGNHPHWIQPVELYNGKFIVYAHGNFVFDQEWSEETKLGVVGRYTFYEGKLVDVEYLPIRIVDYGQPYFLEGDEAASVLNRLIVQ